MDFLKRSEKTYSRKLTHSLNSALEGIIHTLKVERNMRIHFLIGFIVLLAGVYLKLTNVEFMLLCIAVFFVLICEMFNTAVEHTVDLINDEFHPLAKIIKDIAAGAVFVASVNAIITGYVLLVQRIGPWYRGGFDAIRQSPYHVTAIALLAVVTLVIAIKAVRREKQLLRGGMPSGHSAVAFAVWVMVSLITNNALVSILVFCLALLIARSRVAENIHTVWEVISGSLLGALTTLLIFQLLTR